MNRVSLEFPSFQDFLRDCSPFISEQGMFLRTGEVQPVGARVGFDVGLGDDFPILRGAGEVVWVVDPDPEGIGSPGMALRYTETDDATQRLIRKIAERHRERTGEVFALERPLALGPAGESPVDELDKPAAAEVRTEAPDLTPADEAPTEEAAAGVLSLPDDEVAPAVLPPGLEEAMAASETGRSRSGTAVWLALAAVAIAAVGYWQRDFLAAKLGGGSDRSTPSSAEAPLDTVDLQTEALAPEPGVPEQATPQAARPEQAEAGAPVAGLDEAELAPPIATPSQRAPLTRIEDISWLSGQGSTLLMLRADGTFVEGSYKVESLGGESPRAILKISGVTAPYEAGTAEVGTAEVQRVRTGLHPSELHVVLDLASPAARVTSVEVDGVVLQVRVSTGAGSP